MYLLLRIGRSSGIAMRTVSDIIDALGGSTAFGRICGFTKNPGARGSDMRQRESIPVVYWPRKIGRAHV